MRRWRSGSSPIPAQKRVPADRENVEKHLNAVAQHIHFRRGRMPPAHGNFHGAQPVMPRQIEQFRIEPEPFDALLLEYDFAALAPECLEPALRIDKGKSQDQPHYGVEHNAGEFPETRLMDGNEAAVESPRSNRDIVGLQRFEELWRFLDRRGKVGV